MYIRKKTWGPRKRDVTPKTVMSMTVERAKDSTEHKKVAVTCTLYMKQEVMKQRILLQQRLFPLKDH